jgi:hypothetical protein
VDTAPTVRVLGQRPLSSCASRLSRWEVFAGICTSVRLLIAAVRVCENGDALPFGANSLDEASQMSQRALDPCSVSVANLVQRLNGCVGILAQLFDDGIRLVDKLDDCAASICACAPNGAAVELGDSLDPLWVVQRSEVHDSWLALTAHHSARELAHVQDLASFPASVLHL